MSLKNKERNTPIPRTVCGIQNTAISYLTSVIHSWKSNVLSDNANQEPISRFFKWGKNDVLRQPRILTVLYRGCIQSPCAHYTVKYAVRLCYLTFWHRKLTFKF
jgi:hypothetical protein